MNTQALLKPFADSRTIQPMVVRAIGTLACRVAAYLDLMLYTVFGEFAATLPVAIFGHDSASAPKSTPLALPGCEPRPIPPGLIHQYTGYSVAALREKFTTVKATQLLAEQLGAIPDTETSENGCCQMGPYAKALYVANLQQVKEVWAPAILKTREAERIAKCRNQGFQIVQSSEVRVVRICNSGGSTGQGAEVVDALLGKTIAKDKGLRLKQDLIGFQPSCSDSVNETALKINSGKFWLEAILAKTAPGKIRLETLENQTIRYTDSDGIYHSLIPFAVTSAYQSAATRDETGLRVALMILSWITSPYLRFSDLEYADALAAQQDHRFGAPALRRIGYARTVYCPELNHQIMRDAALKHVHEIL
jgi:hypothetical protein